MTILGIATSRVDGRAKVTGAAKYAAEYNVPGLAQGFVITSAIAKGRIARIDFADALGFINDPRIFGAQFRAKF